MALFVAAVLLRNIWVLQPEPNGIPLKLVILDVYHHFLYQLTSDDEFGRILKHQPLGFL